MAGRLSPAAVAGQPKNEPRKVGDTLAVDELTPNPAAFDAVAAAYDADFSGTALARILRWRVWRRLERSFGPGQSILELACGTGEDACWLAGRGVEVTATDGSAEMVRIAAGKARRAGLEELVATRQLSLQAIISGDSPLVGRQFDGVFSDFGGINTIDDWRGLARGLAGLVRPGGRVVLVPMGPLCPWEIGWHLLHGRPAEGLRRLGRRPSARVGDEVIPLWYPSAGRLRRAFEPWFGPVAVESLGLWLPPAYLGQLLSRWPGLWVVLSGLEAAGARLTGGLGDHYILTLERNDEQV